MATDDYTGRAIGCSRLTQGNVARAARGMRKVTFAAGVAEDAFDVGK